MPPTLPFQLYLSRPMTMETRGHEVCGLELSISCRNRSARIHFSGQSVSVLTRLRKLKGYAMLQPVTASNYQVLPPCRGKQLPPTRSLRTQLEEVAKRSACDLSALYPQAVLKSSDE